MTQRKKFYCNLSNIAGIYALNMNGLGEAALSQPLCLCTNPEIIKKFELSSKICVKPDICGVCFLKSKCQKDCLQGYDNLCRH